jgi:hypothetical protein
MAKNPEDDRGQRVSLWSVAIWTAPAAMLLVPLVAMQFSTDVRWTRFDFIVAGLLLYGAVFTYELITRRTASGPYRAAGGVAVMAGLMLVWVNLAVGMIGSENDPANLMFGGVLAIGIIGAIVARFEPAGMARALVATALAQAAVAVIALVNRWGSTGPSWPRDILGTTALFAVLWVISAALFQKAARGGLERRSA